MAAAKLEDRDTFTDLPQRTPAALDRKTKRDSSHSLHSLHSLYSQDDYCGRLPFYLRLVPRACIRVDVRGAKGTENTATLLQH